MEKDWVIGPDVVGSLCLLHGEAEVLSLLLTDLSQSRARCPAAEVATVEIGLGRIAAVHTNGPEIIAGKARVLGGEASSGGDGRHAVHVPAGEGHAEVSGHSCPTHEVHLARVHQPLPAGRWVHAGVAFHSLNGEVRPHVLPIVQLADHEGNQEGRRDEGNGEVVPGGVVATGCRPPCAGDCWQQWNRGNQERQDEGPGGLREVGPEGQQHRHETEDQRRDDPIQQQFPRAYARARRGSEVQPARWPVRP
mmetsp:Transcript_63399/g.138044  ORF Transcript_63399/g.138044 Transcript_63399/m.138044 type:complete len:250 (-) Transcript_63399:207-956(-)